MAAPDRLNIVYFEDDEDLVVLMGHLMNSDDTTVIGVRSHFLAAVDNDILFPPHTVALVDWMLSTGVTGGDVLDRLKSRRPSVPVVLFSAVVSHIPELYRAKADLVIEKPIGFDELEQLLSGLR